MAAILELLFQVSENRGLFLATERAPVLAAK
jgi:hypothetical protein